MRIGRANRRTRRKQCHFVHHISHITWPGIETESPQCEPGELTAWAMVWPILRELYSCGLALYAGTERATSLCGLHRWNAFAAWLDMLFHDCPTCSQASRDLGINLCLLPACQLHCVGARLGAITQAGRRSSSYYSFRNVYYRPQWVRNVWLGNQAGWSGNYTFLYSTLHTLYF
jgi:hypothetical protein